ncbi:hypothetical protein BJY01DRAFT_194177 [Aspergillus pseudoustus]|uniref:BZIP domain-containing protein n=1 Tax=Aspergillus pseudoustus TaxID=1810923 RepID=A0ABR4JTZ8_9EURO
MVDRPRVTFEKSRVVRRRYQRSNQRFQFTESQIARIEREEERKHRAEKLREKEKRRIKEKKQRAEKEAKEREERLRLGLPDPNAHKLPASQPLLFNFIKRPSPAKPAIEEKEIGSGNESDSTVGEEGIDELLMELGDTDQPAGEKSQARPSEAPWVTGTGEDDEFSDCSFDEEVLEETESISKNVATDKVPTVPGLAKGESFMDDTALLLEELGQEFDPSSSFNEALAYLDQ